MLNSQGSGEGIESRVEEGDFGHEGSGIWARGPLSAIRDNVVASCRLSDYAFFVRGVGNVRIPLFKGADKSNPKQGKTIGVGPIRNFTGNEAYGATKVGLTFWYFNGQNVIDRFTAWHVHAHGILPFYSSNITEKDIVVRGDAARLTDPKENSLGLRFNQGPYIRDIIVANKPQLAFALSANPKASLNTLMRRESIRLLQYSHNGTNLGDIQLFYTEQDKGFLIPKLKMTNEQAWNQLGVAVGDFVAPCSATRLEIGGGFTCPLTDLGALVVLASRNPTNQPNYTLVYLVDGKKVTEPTPTPLLEGENWLTRTIALADGSQGLKTFFVTLDTIPPVIELDPKTPTKIGLINALKLQVNYTITDNLDGKHRKHKIFTNLPVGDNVLTITAKDKAGNSAIPVTFTITVDPTITDVIDDGLCGMGRPNHTGHGKESR